MAKKKTSSKKAPMRQALLTEKEATARFDENNILNIKYDPDTKLTVVQDIPDNLSSRFILGDSSTGELTPEIKLALLECFAKVAWIDEHGQSYYENLRHALMGDRTLDHITAVYTQSGTVYDTDSLDSLKDDLVVTATYDDSSTETVTAYTLSGTLVVGTSTITVSYGGKTTTFNVNVTAAPRIVEHTYVPNYYTAITNPSDMVLTSGMVVSGGKVSHNGRVDPAAAAVAGRCADKERVLVGNFGGKTLGLSSYTLTSGSSVAFACWIGTLASNETWDGTKYLSTNNNFLANAWLTSNVTLPSSNDENVLVIAFRKGTGSDGDFTTAEMEEIPSLITIS